MQDNWSNFDGDAATDQLDSSWKAQVELSLNVPYSIVSHTVHRFVHHAISQSLKRQFNKNCKADYIKYKMKKN